MRKEDQHSNEIIGAAIEVHRFLGPGLLESAYEECLCREFVIRGLSFERQKSLAQLLTYLKLSNLNLGV